MKSRISDDRLVRLLRLVVVTGTVYALAGILVLAAVQEWREFGETASALLILPILVAVVWVGVSAEPRSRLVWVLLIWLLIIGAYPVAIAVRLILEPQVPLVLDIETQIPAELPPAVAWIEGVISGVGSLGLFLLLTFGVLLFPDGRLPSPRWRWVAGVFAVGLALVAVINFLLWNPSMTVAPARHSLFHLLTPFVLGAPLTAIASLAVRYRRSQGEIRARIRWILWGAVVAIPLIVLSMILGGEVLDTVGFLVFFSAYGIAIVRHNLFDVDVVIARTLVYGVLAGLIGVVYVSIVVGIGSLLGGSDLGWSIAATAIVAVVFEPVRSRIQRWVNRLVYGRRATPYEVLADLTGRLARTEREEGLLDRMATRVAEGTGADRVVVWTATAGGFEPLATEPAEPAPRSAETSLRDLPGVAVPIEHDGEVLGALSVETRRGEALSGTERRLIDDLTGSVGLAMRRRRLDEELERRARELADSRRRLVGAQDEERRRLERELGRGVQQQVMALREQLDLIEVKARAAGLDQVAVFLDQMSTETQDAITQIRALAHGIYPPLLEAEGLTAAVKALAELAPVEVELRHQVGRRHPLPVEAAAYFCVSEALTNAVKHGRPPIVIELSDENGDLRFEVSDAGPGFDPATATRGSGLNNLVDRLDALGGSVTVDSAPGRPTVIRGRLPLTAAVGAVPAAAGI
jgi:signal transduction histidine kinase